MKVRKIPISFEKQSTPYTCGAKALQLVLNYFNPKKYPLGDYLEMEIFRRAKLGNYNAVTHPGLALVALEEGFEVEYLMLYEEMFRYPERVYPGYTMPREEFEEKVMIDREYLKKAKEKGLKIVIVKTITGDLLRSYIDRNIPLIGMIDNLGQLHDIIINGYKITKYFSAFYITDPWSGQRGILEKELINLLSTRYGVGILAIKNEG